MKKRILIGVLSLCLLAAPLSTMEVQAATQAQGTTEFTYRSTKKTQIDRGGTSVKTGDSTELGNWLMLASGSGILLLLLIGLKKESRGGKWGGIIPGKKKVQSVISA